MNRELYFFLSLSIVFAGILGVVRFKKIDESYRPFLFYVFISLLNEIASFFFASHTRYAMIDLNLFTLFEFCILALQFYRWKVFQGIPKMFPLLLAGFFAIWFTESIIISRLYVYNYGNILAHSFIMVLLSINLINRIAVNDYGPLYRNAKFIICIGIIVFFIYNIIVNTLFLNAASKSLARRFFDIRVYVNTFSNLLYAVGVYFMPEAIKRSRFLK